MSYDCRRWFLGRQGEESGVDQPVSVVCPVESIHEKSKPNVVVYSEAVRSTGTDFCTGSIDYRQCRSYRLYHPHLFNKSVTIVLRSVFGGIVSFSSGLLGPFIDHQAMQFYLSYDS